MLSLDFLNDIAQILAFLSVIVGIIFFIFMEWRKKRQNYDANTIQSLQNAVNALEKERDVLKAENAQLRGQLAAMEQTLKKTDADIKMLKDLATGASKIDGLSEMLARFEFIIPMMKSFQDADAQQLRDLSEIRQMIRDDRKATESNEKTLGKLKTNLEKVLEYWEATQKAGA